MKEKVKEDAVVLEAKSEEKVEEKVEEANEQVESEEQKQSAQDPASKEVKVDVVEKEEESLKVAGKENSGDEVQVFSDQVTPDKQQPDSQKDDEAASKEQD